MEAVAGETVGCRSVERPKMSHTAEQGLIKSGAKGTRPQVAAECFLAMLLATS